MIVDDDKVMAALDFLNDSPVSRALFAVLTTESASKRARARAYQRASGSIPDRNAAAELDPEYVAAVDAEIEAQVELQGFKDQREGAIKILDAWNIESANIRHAEKMK